ncbi:MAG: SulP family inorganic anion transporter [Candidatus Melainabacteria bacterium]|nr:SulP family inorganic anion transporter [Candidatus Melainabacteria bacterium]
MNTLPIFSKQFYNSRYFKRRHYFKDLLASVVVFLVALPLAMGISIASGMPPATGLITCIVGGLIVAPIAGSPLQVSGPAAGLSVIVYEILQQHGAEKLGVIIVLAGIMQLAMGIMKMGQWFRAVSPAVVNGMLAGIGILIFASQFHVMLDDAPKSTGLLNLAGIPVSLFDRLTETAVNSSHIAGCLGVLTIVVIILWEAIPIKQIKMIPSSLVAVVLATALTAIFNLPIKHVELPENLFSVVKVPTHWGHFWDLNILLEAMGLALLASAETLLSAIAVDKMQPLNRTKYDKELLAQGVGNTICGMLCSLPMTGVIVRSSVNIRAGAKSRMSAFFHGLWIFLLVISFPAMLRLIPTSALAALLVYTGYKLTNFKIVKELRRADKIEVAIYFITMGAIVATDLLTGVMTGVALSIAKLVYMFSHLEIKTVTNAENQTATQTAVHLRGAATFLNLPKLAEALESVPPNTELHIHLEELDYVDHASLEMIMTWEQQHKATGGLLVIDWGTLGSMFRDRRRTPREEPKPVAVVEDAQSEDSDDSGENEVIVATGSAKSGQMVDDRKPSGDLF